MSEFDGVSETILFALCLYGECRGEKIDAKVAHANAIWNRHINFKWTLRKTILQPKHFSCFNEGDPNLEVIREIVNLLGTTELNANKYKSYWECYWCAYGVMNDYLQDNTDGADHYNTIDCDPSWDDNMIRTAVYGRTEFFKRG